MFDMKALYEPASVDEAIGLLAEHRGSGVLAGGSDILVKLRDGKLLDREWVSIFGLDELRQITVDDAGTIRVGPLCSFTKVATSEIVRRNIGSLAEAVSTIGGPQVRNIGTIGGNICNGVPSADSASTCFAWKAQIELTGPDGVRTLPIEDFYITAGKVDLREAELMTGILFHRAAYEGFKGSYFKYAMRNAMDIATVNCATVVKLSDDKCSFDEVRMAFGVAAPTPIRVPSAEQLLAGQPTTKKVVDAAARASIADTRARDSWRASKSFRQHMLEEMARRCLIKSIRRAGGEMRSE